MSLLLRCMCTGTVQLLIPSSTEFGFAGSTMRTRCYAGTALTTQKEEGRGTREEPEGEEDTHDTT